jgi:hypothetical protein
MIFAETLIAGYGIPVDTIATYQHGWKLGKELCLATGFVLTTLGKTWSQYYERNKSKK